MNPRISRFRPLPFVLVAFVVLFGGACAQPASPPASNASAPPTDSSEQTVRSSDGRAAAQLIVSATRIRPHDRVKVYIENQGEVALNHGRPVVVERWNGAAWEETDESRNTAWTMELLQVEPGRAGVEQSWPFQAEQRPAPGWYRFTKDLYAEGAGGEAGHLVVRARVEVVRP